jgi:aryl-alcohol dehydrogenase-like predicted oxidoreductase
MLYSRRDALKIGAAAGATAFGQNALFAAALRPQPAQLLNTIPSTSERIPALGLGTHTDFSTAARVFQKRGALREVLSRFTEMGGRVIDTAPPYRDSEGIVARLTEEIGGKDEIFWAAKLAIRASGGRDAGMIQVERSMERLGHIDLSQIYDLLRWRIQLPLLQDLKHEGRIRYVGITTSGNVQHEELARILRTEDLDFVQFDYAIDNRNAEAELIPICRDRGIGAIVNSPFGRGRLFERVGGAPVPEWAQEFGARTWAQFFLKWVLANDAVTVVIPSTANPDHVQDNMDAGLGRLPTDEERSRMARLIEELPRTARHG